MPDVTPSREIWALCRVPRGELCLLRHTLEAYEGLCFATSLPGGQGLVRLLTSEDRRQELEEVLDALGREVGLEGLEWREGTP